MRTRVHVCLGIYWGPLLPLLYYHLSSRDCSLVENLFIGEQKTAMLDILPYTKQDLFITKFVPIYSYTRNTCNIWLYLPTPNVIKTACAKLCHISTLFKKYF